MYTLSNTTTTHVQQPAGTLQKKAVPQQRQLPAVPVLQKQPAPVQRIEDPANKEKALELHQADQDRVYKLVNDAAAAKLPASPKPTRAKLLKNTAELIQNGFATLIVMTRTHAAPELRSETEVGYFDLTIKYPTKGGDYNLAQDNHIYMAPKSIQGHADHRGEIRFYDPSAVSDEDLITVLIHEMQHQADFHNKGESFAQPGLDEHAAMQFVNAYQSEFRAYWIGGIFKERKHLGTFYDRLGFSFIEADNTEKVESGSMLKANFTTQFKNLRQQNIFWHMVNSGSYPYVLTAYQNSAAFRNMVHNFSMPVGGNLLNSIRIDNVRRSIVSLAFKKRNYSGFLRNAEYDMPKEEYAEKLLSHQTQVKDATTLLENTRDLLDQEDLEFLNDRSQSAPFWDFVTSQLGVDLCGELYEFITYRRMQIRRAEIYK